MGFIKSDSVLNEKKFNTISDAKNTFLNYNNSESDRIDALSYIISNSDLEFLLNAILDFEKSENSLEHSLIDNIFSGIDLESRTHEEYRLLFNILNSKNAYLRNRVITYLQDCGEYSKEFIKDLLVSDDKDMRVFAVNILGDVNYEESRELLLELIKKEENINVLMTAIDYIGEIGLLEDIELLKNIKSKYLDNSYITFGIDLAIDKIEA